MSTSDYRTEPEPSDAIPPCLKCKSSENVRPLEVPHPKARWECVPCGLVFEGSKGEARRHAEALIVAAAESSEGHALLRDGVEAARLHLEGDR